MHIQTHFMSGWCLCNYFNLNAKERFLAILAATIPDIDGITYIFGQNAYWATHHVYGHNLIFAIVLSLILMLFCSHKVKGFFLFFSLVNIHFLMDLLGSGEGWGIPYFLPFSDYIYEYSGVWDFNGIENKLVGLFFLLWCIVIAIFKKRTPLEFIMPKLDLQLVNLLSKQKQDK